MIYFYNLKL